MPLFAEEDHRRAALRCLASVAGGDLALFVLVDEHAHLVLCDETAPPWRTIQALRCSWRVLDGFVDLQPTWMGAVEGRSHAENLLGYVLGQSKKHALPTHPALWSGSCLADLVGARVLPGFDPHRVELLLPRFRPQGALAAVGLARVPAPADEDLRRIGAQRIASAAAAAFAAPADLRGMSDPVFRARAAAASLHRQVGIAATETAFALDISARTARRLRASDAPHASVVRVHLALQAAAPIESSPRAESAPRAPSPERARAAR